MTEYLDQTREAEQHLRDATREAHGAIKSLNQLKREIDELVAGIPGRVHKVMEDSLNAAIDEGRDGLAESFRESARSAELAVFARFHVISSILMGEPDTGSSLEEKAEKLRRLLLRNGVRPAVMLMRNDSLPPALRDMVAFRDTDGKGGKRAD